MQTDLHRLLLQAALLSGEGPDAAGLAERWASAAEGGEGRSCLDAGSVVQVHIDAPGGAGSRLGVRVDPHVPAPDLGGLVPAASAATLLPLLADLGPPWPDPSTSTGTWVFRELDGATVYADLATATPRRALDRLLGALGRLDRMAAFVELLDVATPWAVGLRLDADGQPRAHLRWLVRRRVTPGRVAERLAPGPWWQALRAAFRPLLGGDVGAVPGRWVVTTDLDRPGAALEVATTAWAFVPAGLDKQRALVRAVAECGGDPDLAGALFSLLAPTDGGRRRRAGRALALRFDGQRVSLRATLAPTLVPTRASNA